MTRVLLVVERIFQDDDVEKADRHATNLASFVEGEGYTVLYQGTGLHPTPHQKRDWS